MHQVSVNKSLLKFIDLSQTIALNSTKKTEVNLAKIFTAEPKEQVYLASDAGDQLMVKISLHGFCKIKAIAVQTDATKLKAFVNDEKIGFGGSSLPNPQQEWELGVGLEGQLVEYPTKVYKFSHVSFLSLLFEGQRTTTPTTTRIHGIRLLGEAMDLSRGPVIANYELRPQLSDHKTGSGLFDVQSGNQY